MIEAYYDRYSQDSVYIFQLFSYYVDNFFPSDTTPSLIQIAQVIQEIFIKKSN